MSVVDAPLTDLPSSYSFSIKHFLADRRTSRKLLVFISLLLVCSDLRAQTNPGAYAVTGSLNTAREYHTATATLLNDGTVLTAGGYNGGYVSSAELYHPATLTFSVTGSLHTPRYSHTATLLTNGMVLITGGYSSSGYLSRCRAV
jgi:hypothetical protein